MANLLIYDDVIKCKHFPCYWLFVLGIHRVTVNSPHKGQWSRALIFSLVYAWTNAWVNNRGAGDLRRHRVHYNVTAMSSPQIFTVLGWWWWWWWWMVCGGGGGGGGGGGSQCKFIVRRAGLLWSQQDFEWRWSVPLFKCLTVLEFSFILFDLCLLITFFNFIMNYVPIVTFWIFIYHKIWILSIMFCFIWSYWIIYFLACLEVSWRVVS